MTNTDLGGGSPNAPRQTGGDGCGNLKDMAAGAVETVKAEARSFAETAQQKAADAVGEHQDTAARTLGDFANAIRKAGEDLAQHDQSMASRLVRQAADGLEGFTRSVGDKRPEELLQAVRDFGRRNPAAFIAGSVLLGLAVGRLVKSSEPDTGSSDGAGPGGQPGSSTPGVQSATAGGSSASPSATSMGGGMSTVDPASGIAHSTSGAPL